MSRPTRLRRPASTAPASWPASRRCCAALPARLVLRTSWVYAPAGKNFVLHHAERGASGPTGCGSSPTSAAARPPPPISPRRSSGHRADRGSGWQDEYGGIFHAAGSGWTTWHGLAGRDLRGGRATRARRSPAVEPISTAEWPTPARRPPDSRLDCGKLERTLRPAPAGMAGQPGQRTVEAIFSAQDTAASLRGYGHGRLRRHASRSCSRRSTASASCSEQLDSLLAQTHRDWVLYWRDDGSSDRTVARAARLRRRAGAGPVRRCGAAGAAGADRQLSLPAAGGAPPAGPTRSPSPTRTMSGCPRSWRAAARALRQVPADAPALYCARQILVDERLRPDRPVLLAAAGRVSRRR